MVFNISQLGDVPAVPEYVSNQISLKGVSQEGFNIFFLVGISIAIIILLIIIIYIYTRQKNKNSSTSFNNSNNLNSLNTSNKSNILSNNIDASNNCSKNSSSKSLFDESFEKGINFLNSKDFKSARLEYYNMKNIAEKSGEKRLIDKALDFYKKYGVALNEKK